MKDPKILSVFTNLLVSDSIGASMVTRVTGTRFFGEPFFDPLIKDLRVPVFLIFWN